MKADRHLMRSMACCPTARSNQAPPNQHALQRVMVPQPLAPSSSYTPVVHLAHVSCDGHACARGAVVGTLWCREPALGPAQRPLGLGTEQCVLLGTPVESQVGVCNSEFGSASPLTVLVSRNCCRVRKFAAAVAQGCGLPQTVSCKWEGKSIRP